MDDPTNENESRNEYLELRKAKIARNEARLAELGLLKRESHSLSASLVGSSASTIHKQKQKQIQTSYHGEKYPSSTKTTVPISVRRSSRQTNRPESYMEASKDATTLGRRRTRSSTMIAIKQEGDGDKHTPSPSHVYDDTKLVSLPSSRKRAKPSSSTARGGGSSVSKVNPRSVRLLYLHVEQLLLQGDALGRIMAHTGKAHVIEEAAHKAVCMTKSSESCSVTPASFHSLSFNKYCGVQEWYNDAIFLWVNIGSPQSDVVNEFLEGGRKVTWYGGSSMHDESKQILNLRRVGQSAAAATGNTTGNTDTPQIQNPITTDNADGDHFSSNMVIPSKDTTTTTTTTTTNGDGIVLWCRQYQKKTKTFGPYTCLGRLAYESHIPGSRPIKFVWTLLDYDRLVHHSDGEVQDTFQAIQRLANNKQSFLVDDSHEK